MYESEFTASDKIDSNALLGIFLEHCQNLVDDGSDDYTLSYVADTVAAIYYYREFDSCEKFLQVNADAIDEERADWVKYMWRTLDSMDEFQRADVVIESLTQLPAISGK
jgi:hypothetical protein